MALKKVKRDFETVNNLVEEDTCELIQTIFNNIINVNNWVNKIKEDQEIREPKVDRHTQQDVNAVADALI